MKEYTCAKCNKTFNQKAKGFVSLQFLKALEKRLDRCLVKSSFAINQQIYLCKKI